MRMMKTCLMVAMILLMSVMVEAEGTKTVKPVTWSTTMPAIELSNQPLEKVLNEIKEKLPGFNFSISRENVPHDYPILPTMTVENVSLDQFFQLVLNEIPGVQIQTNFGGEDMGSAVFCRVTVTPNPNIVRPDVRVFGLAEIIAYRASLMKGDGDHVKQATDDILSLIQAALVDADPSIKPELKLHPATQVLICTVTSGQNEAIKEVLDALKPKESDQVAKLRSDLVELQEKYKFSQSYRDAFEIRARTLQAQEADKGVEIDKLTAELEEAKRQLTGASFRPSQIDTKEQVIKILEQALQTTAPNSPEYVQIKNRLNVLYSQENSASTTQPQK